MDCGTSLVKYVLFIFNTLVSVLGILAIVFGVLILNSIGHIKVDGQVGYPPQAVFPMGLITIGSIVLIISFLGCCGAIREDVCMTMCYAVVMLILLILQLIMVVMLWLNKDEIINGMDNVVELAWKQDLREPGIFDAIQKSLSCCGADSYVDYITIVKAPPPSCCPSGSTCTPFNYYSGCKTVLNDFMTGSTEKAKYFGIGLIAVELVGFIFACCLANNVRNYKRRNNY